MGGSSRRATIGAQANGGRELKASIPNSHVRSFFSRADKIGAAAVTAVAIAGCGAAAASSGAPHASPAATRPAATRPTAATTKPAATKPSRAALAIDRLTVFAKQQYAGEVHGTRAIQTLHSVGRDPTLLRLLGSRDLTAARGYITQQYRDVWYHWHVSRLRIVQGSRLVSEQGVPFVIPASHMTLRGADGRNLGTLAVSMQDEIGVVRLLHREYPKLQVVIRSQRSHQLRTSMYSAAFVKLPLSGTVRISGGRYLVRSFHEKDWSGERVTIWLLMKG
jgi:hypothetical protein